MQRYIDSDKVNAALDRIRDEVWLHDIPSPTVPEYIEHHETMQRLMIVVDKERERLNDAADVATARHGRWVVYKAPDAYHCGLVKCPFCGEEMIAESDEYNYCPNCGAKMDGGAIGDPMEDDLK